MADIPEDIKSGLKSLATRVKCEPKVLVEELKEFMANDETIKGMSPDQTEFKIRYAWALLCRRHTSVSKAIQMYLRPLSKPTGGKTKAGKPRCDLFAMVKRITTDDQDNQVVGSIEIAAGTVWEKAAEAASKLSPKKIYKTSLPVKEVKATPDGGATTIEGLELSGNDAMFIETSETTMPTNEEFYKELIEPREKAFTIPLDEADLNSQTNRIDIRVVKVMIIDNRTGERADKSEYGQYVVTDDSLLGSGEKGKQGSVTWWIAPEEVTMEKGVVLKAIVTGNYDKTNNKVNWSYFFSIPVGLSVKRKIEVKPVEKKTESVDPDSLDDDIEKPKPKEMDDDFAV